MLKLIDVKKVYTTKVGDVAAMDGVTVEFPDHGMIFINGKSGSGKTTLLNVVGGLDGFDSGEIIIDGKNFSTFNDSDYDSYRNTFVGFIFQEYNLLPDYTVEKNIKIANELQGKETSDERIKELMEEFDIAGLQNRKISELSGGQKQRVAIVRSLVKDPKIIMADEPTGALDSSTGIQVTETLKKLSKDKLVIVVSHDLELAEKYADRIIRIVDGKIVEDVSISDTEITGSLHTDDEGLTVKMGAELNPHETEELLKAIREKRQINFTEKVMIRQKQKTQEVKDAKPTGNVKLINSKMKFRSAAELGIKSLGIKPGRLIFTILLSVVAFAVFGLFDTIASYHETKTIQNVLRKSDYQAVSVYQMYGSDSPYYCSDSLSSNSNLLKFSKEDVEKLNRESGYNFRPVYDLNDATLSDFISRDAITKFIHPDTEEEEKIEVGRNTPKNIGALYYIPEVTGFVEFKNDEIEYEEVSGVKFAKTIDKDGFNLKLIAGNLPKFKYNAKTGTANDNEVAITRYLAETILYWREKNVDYTSVDLLLGATIVVDKVEYVITGIYDTAPFPKKYDELKEIPKITNTPLGDDFQTYLNAGLYSNFIVGEGFIDYYMTNKRVYDVAKERIPGHYAQNQEYSFTFTETKPYQISTASRNGRFYNVRDIDTSKIIMFDAERNEDITLADDEVLISVEYLDDLYAYEKSFAANSLVPTIHSYYYPFGEQEDVLLHRSNLKATAKMKTALGIYMDNIKALIENAADIKTENHIKTLRLDISEKEEFKEFKVVGVYTGVDTDINDHTSSYTIYPVAMTSNGLNSIYVNPNQGVFGRLIAPVTSSRSATGYLAEKMTNNDVKFIWYGNNALSMINEGGKMIMQFANLFLYVAIVLAAFSIFMLYNYISASIIAKKQSIGVLRALGSGCKDIIIMFITESLIIAIINGILASFVAAGGCVLVNMYIRNVMNLAIDFALYDVRQVIIIITASIVTAIASSLIPIIKISKEKPVNLIREP